MARWIILYTRMEMHALLKGRNSVSYLRAFWKWQVSVLWFWIGHPVSLKAVGSTLQLKTRYLGFSFRVLLGTSLGRWPGCLGESEVRDASGPLLLKRIPPVTILVTPILSPADCLPNLFSVHLSSWWLGSWCYQIGGGLRWVVRALIKSMVVGHTCSQPLRGCLRCLPIVVCW